MVGLWILIALLGLLVFIALLPIVISARLHMEGLQGRIQYRIGIGPVSIKGAKAIGEAVAQAPKTKRKAKRAMPDFLPKSPEKMLQWARPAINLIRQKLRFRRLDLFVVVGGLDAFESALLAGAVWTITGTLGSILSHIFTLPQGIYRVTVQPNWREPALGLNLDCMVTLRVGHAIWAGVLLVPQALRSARAVRRRRKRQKGEETRG